MRFELLGALFFIILSLSILLFLEIGRRIGVSADKTESRGLFGGVGPVETIIFGLLGLLIAFTFTGAESRFEARRQLITTEANTIGTAYLRIDLLPSQSQTQMRQLLKEYTTLRATMYHYVGYKIINELHSNKIPQFQNQIWKLAVSGCDQSGSTTCAMLLLPALNEMFDITTTRAVSTQNHPPYIIYILLIVISLFGALLIGYNLSNASKRNLLYMLTYAVIISLLIYLIIDLELPRFGLIRIDAADNIILSLTKAM